MNLYLTTSEDDPESIEVVFEAIRDRCEKKFQLFSEIFFNHFTQYAWNQFHHSMFSYYETKTYPAREVDCAPRGYAKSTIKTLFKPVHDICYGTQKYILFISATAKQSGEKLKDIRAEVMENELLRAVYGIHFKSKRVNAESFEVHTDRGTTFLRSVSAGTEVRGLRYREHRPSKIILDDAEASEEVLSEDRREKTWDWFSKDISKLGSGDTDIEIVGTVLHRDSLLMKLKRNPAYSTRIWKSVIKWPNNMKLWKQWEKIYINLDDNDRLIKSNQFYEENKEELNEGVEVLWPEKEDILFLMKEKLEIGDRAFASEKQNTPMPDGDALFDNIWWYKDAERDGVEGVEIERTGRFIPYTDMESYAAMDPATGESSTKSKTKLDYTSLVCGRLDLKGRLFVDKDWTKRAKPTEYIRQIFEHHLEMQFEKFAIEENLYRGLLTENVIRERKRLERERRKDGLKNWGLRIPFYEILNRENKIKRIYTLEPKVNNGWILFNRSLSPEFMDMIEHFPSKEMHDDGPDALEMLWGLVNGRYKVNPIDLDAMGSK